jgi:hypothetical protein
MTVIVLLDGVADIPAWNFSAHLVPPKVTAPDTGFNGP